MLSKGAKSESSELMIRTGLPIPTVAASPSSSAAPPLPLSPPWIELPEDLTVNILQRLNVEEIIMSAQLVCSTWWRVCKNPAMWRVIHLNSNRLASYNAVNIFRCAVDRSQGQLLELKLSGFLVDDLLDYAAERSSQLRCLTLEVYITLTNLVVAIKRLAQLEELQLIMNSWFTLKDVETIGISCPMLKSFTFSNCRTFIVDFSEHAVAIGKTMPNLCHLRLFKLRIENKGLEAILDGCPNLELLHLLQCSDFDLQGGLGKRCYDQIKDLILDSESSQSERDQADYYWDDDHDPSYSSYDIDHYDPLSIFPGNLSDYYDSDPDFY